jgi:hypothetical protein
MASINRVFARLFEGQSGWYKSTNPGLRYWVVLPLGRPSAAFRAEAEVQAITRHRHIDLGVYIVLQELGVDSPVHQQLDCKLGGSPSPWDWFTSALVIDDNGVHLRELIGDEHYDE